MMKKLLLAAGAFALGVGAGIGICAYLNKKRRIPEEQVDYDADLASDVVAEAEDAPAIEEVQPPVAKECADEAEAVKKTIRETLATFNVRIDDKITHVSGPHVTAYEPMPSLGTSVRSILNRMDDLSLVLGERVRAYVKRGENPAFVIEVPNKRRETVRYAQLKADGKKPLEVPIGVGIGNETVCCDLTKMPHLLLAGTVGSGKSVFLHSVLLSLVEKNTPRDLRLVLIDPKMIEFSVYKHLPHLLTPVVTDPVHALAALRRLTEEMENRFSLMKEKQVRNINTYNEAVKDEPEKHMPYIVVVIDELVDLKMALSAELDGYLSRLAQKARTAGIHLIVSTQRPTADVVTGQLKCNIPSRIAFMVKQQIDSRMILEQNGAELLCGQGEFLYQPSASGTDVPVRVQCAFVSEEELREHLDAVRKAHPAPTYDAGFPAMIEKLQKELEEAQEEKEEEPPLSEETFFKAAEVVYEAGKAATSLLQRRLYIGYSLAARLIDRMEELGMVTPAQGNKPRSIDRDVIGAYLKKCEDKFQEGKAPSDGFLF